MDVRITRRVEARRWGAAVACVAVAAATFALPAAAATTTVTTLNDSGPGSLRQALADAPAGATVDFADGLTGTVALGSELVLARDVTVRGPGGAGITLSGQDRTRVVRVVAGRATLHRLTIRDGSRQGFGSHADGGGVLVERGAALTVTRTAVRDNETWGWGGGIASRGTLVVDESTIAHNVGGPGGGIANVGGAALTVRRSTIADNRSRVVFTEDDWGDASGGGIANVGGPALVASSTLSGNHSANEGGAIADQGVSLRIVDSTITANSADRGGGIDTAGAITLRNSILAGNRARRAPECNTWAGSSLIDGGHNLLGSTSECSVRERQPGTLLDADPRLGPLADNGGWTRTHHPLHDSPAIDGSAAGEPTDQRGVRRPPAAAAASGRRPDIGAVEADRPYGTGTLAGTVRDADGVPVAGARVTASGAEQRSTSTAADGTYALDVLNGRYDMQAAAFRLPSATGSGRVWATTLTTIDFVLAASRYVVTGTVRDAAGAPLAGVTVRIDDAPLPETQTAPDGTFAIGAVPAGDYVVRALGTSCSADATTAVTVAGPTSADLAAGPRRDAFGYRCEVSRTTPYQAAVTPLNLRGSGQAPVALPFAFPYYGQTYTSAHVCARGYVTFVADNFCHFRGAPIPNFRAPHAAVYAFWDVEMLADRNDSIRTQHVGTGADERFVIEYHELARLSWDGEVELRVSTAISLYRDGRIALQYRGMDGSFFGTGGGAVVGIESPGSDVALQYSAFQPVLTDGLTVLFHPPSA